MRATDVTSNYARAGAWLTTIILSTVVAIILNNLHDAIVPNKVANGNMLFAIIFAGFVSKVVIGIGPIAATFWSNDRVAAAVGRNSWLFGGKGN